MERKGILRTLVSILPVKSHLETFKVLSRQEFGSTESIHSLYMQLYGVFFS